MLTEEKKMEALPWGILVSVENDMFQKPGNPNSIIPGDPENVWILTG